MDKTKKNNLMKETLMIPINIFIYAFYGLKAITVDFVKDFFGSADIIVEDIKSGDEQLSEYNRMKNINKKKPKTYNYSNSVLKKLEAEKAFLLEDLKKTGALRQQTPQVYKFKVREKSGKIITGTMRGFSKLDINAFLLNEGYDVYVIKTSKFINFMNQESSFFGSSKMKDKDLIFFLTQLSTYLKAGLTLANALKILSQQVKKDKNKARIYQSMSFQLSLGEDFSEALEKQRSVFPALLINMIKAAEASGTIIETLNDLVDYYTEINTTKKQMKSAITYPAVILVFATGIITFIMIYIIPQFEGIYAQSDAEMNTITAMVLNTSDFLKNNILYIIMSVVLIAFIIVVCYKKIKAFRTFTQITLMRTPIIKDVIIYNELTIFSKTFASLLRNNVYITESMDILSKITTNEVYKGILFECINNIVKGDKISSAFEGHWAVPDVAYYMIVTGESTGDLANMMQKVSDYYQEMHKSVVNSMKTLLEPVLTAFLALIVGVIIIAVIVPMYGAYDQMVE